MMIENLHDGEPEFVVDMIREAMTHLIRHIEFAYEHWKALNLSFLDDLTGLLQSEVPSNGSRARDLKSAQNPQFFRSLVYGCRSF